MNKLFAVLTIAAAAPFVCLAGCKTVVNNPAPADHTTVIKEEPAHVDNNAPAPKVENNIKVDH